MDGPMLFRQVAAVCTPRDIWFLGPSQSPKPKRHLNRFSRFWRAAKHGRFNRIRQVAPMCISCNTYFLGPTRAHNPNGISIGSAIIAHLTAECRRACPCM